MGACARPCVGLQVVAVVCIGLTLTLSHQVSAASSQLECTPWVEESNDLERPSLSCAKPVDTLAAGESTSGVSAKRPRQLPPWFNATEFADGQRFASKYLFSQFYAPILSFQIFVSFPDIQAVLMSTKKSDTPDRSNKRYLATMLHMKLWYENLAEGSDSAHPLVLDSLLNVRGIHTQLIKKLDDKIPVAAQPSPHPVDEQFWEAVKKDLENSNIPTELRDYPDEVKKTREAGKAKPLSHLVMSLTQWMLGGLQVLFPEVVGIHGASEQEFNAFNHFVAVVGYTLGMEDEYNVAIHPGPGSLEKTRAYYQRIYDLYFIPSMFHIDHDGKVLWEAFCQGFMDAIFGKSYSSFVVKEQIMLLTLEELMGIEAPNVRARLSTTDTVLSAFIRRVVSMMSFATVRDSMSGLAKKYYFEANSMAVFGFNGTNGEDVLEAAYA